jgi:hypothetical protein
MFAVHASTDAHALQYLHASTLPELYYRDPASDLRCGHPVYAPTYGHPAAVPPVHAACHPHPMQYLHASTLPELRHAAPDPDALRELHPATSATPTYAGAGGSP